MPKFALDHGGPTGLATAPLPLDAEESSAFALFELAVKRDPDAVAVTDGIVRLTYAALYDAARGLAGRIANCVPPGGVVVIALPNTPSAVVAILAANAAGRAFIVLDPAHPAQRNALILAGARPSAIVLDSESARCVPIPPNTSPIRIDQAVDAGNVELAPLRPDEPCAVIYTSGSTGRPKGIVESQRTMVYRSCANVIAHHLDAPDRCMTLSTLGTVVGLHQCLGVLFAGGRVLMPPPEAGAGGILSLADAEAVTVLVALPGMIRGFVRLLEMMPNAAARSAFARVRLIRTTSEALPPADLALWRTLLSTDCQFNVVYGQTEITVSDWYIPKGAEAAGTALPVGHIREGVEVAVLDEAGEAADTGELVVRSRYLALGEWVDGACALGRMRCDPTDPTRRILFTGDLVRLEPSGMLHFLGRLDRQIKIRGNRIEPVEIETVLLADPAIRDTAVVARRLGEVTTLLAFVVARDPAMPPDPQAIRARLQAALPAPMVPARVILLDALPRLPSGKVDERRLLAERVPGV